MPQERLSMRKIEEILRLKYGKRLTHRKIARSCGVSAATVSDYVMRAKLAGFELAAAGRAKRRRVRSKALSGLRPANRKGDCAAGVGKSPPGTAA